MGRREPRGRASALPRRGPHLYFICPAELNSADIKVWAHGPKRLTAQSAALPSAGPPKRPPYKTGPGRFVRALMSLFTCRAPPVW